MIASQFGWGLDYLCFEQPSLTELQNFSVWLYLQLEIYVLLAGAWSWSRSPLCRNKYIQACIPHLLGSVGYHTGTNFPMKQNQKFSIGRDLYERALTDFIPQFSMWQAKVSSIDFDYLSYFFLRYNEYKKQREACFSIAQDYLSRLIRSWIDQILKRILHKLVPPFSLLSVMVKDGWIWEHILFAGYLFFFILVERYSLVLTIIFLLSLSCNDMYL